MPGLYPDGAAVCKWDVDRIECFFIEDTALRGEDIEAQE
jgi:hypothetical protein